MMWLAIIPLAILALYMFRLAMSYMFDDYEWPRCGECHGDCRRYDQTADCQRTNVVSLTEYRTRKAAHITAAER